MSFLTDRGVAAHLNRSLLGQNAKILLLMFMSARMPYADFVGYRLARLSITVDAVNVRHIDGDFVSRAFADELSRPAYT